MEDSEDSQSVEAIPNVPSPSRENAPISPPESAESIQIEEAAQEEPISAPVPETTQEADTLTSEPKVQPEKKRYCKKK